MTNGHQPVRAVPIVVLLPPEARGPEFQVTGRWYSPFGLLMPPQMLPCQVIDPSMIVKMFVDLVNANAVHRRVAQDDGTERFEPITNLHLVMGPAPGLTEAPEEIPDAPPKPRIISA